MNLDMIITSASRPDLLLETLESFYKNVKFSGDIKIMLHEDVREEYESKQVKEICKVNNIEFFVHEEPIGLGYALDFLLRIVRSKYVIVWQDDWKLLKEIDLDKVISIMYNNFVNQIIFHKRNIKSFRGNFQKKEVMFDNVILTTTNRWSELPSVWNWDFLKPYWVKTNQCVSWKLVETMNNDQKDADEIAKKYGVFFWGRIGHDQYVEHLGKSIRRYNPNSVYKEMI